MRTAHALGLCIACAAIAFVAAWTVKPLSDAKPAEVAAPPPERAHGTTSEATLGTESMQLTSARRELAEEQQRHQETARELAEARAALEQATNPVPSAASPAQAAESKRPRYVFDSMGAVIADADWQATGESIVKMRPLLIEFADSLAEGKGLPSSVAELQRWNAPLLKLALDAKREGVPGTGISGVFGHPSIVVNMVHAALQQGGAPLDRRQAERLGDLGKTFVVEDEHRLAGYDETEFQIEKSRQEAALKDRLYWAIDGLLTEEQREILHPTAVRGRAGLDLFSSAVLWNAICAPVRFESREGLAKSAARITGPRLSIPEDLRPVLDELAAEWARGFEEKFLAQEPDALYREGMQLGGSTGMPVQRARTAAEHTAAFYRALHERLPTGSTASGAVRKTALVLVPVRVAPKGE